MEIEVSQKQKKYWKSWEKIFEANSSFYVKYDTTGKVQFLFFRNFLLLLKKVIPMRRSLSTSL